MTIFDYICLFMTLYIYMLDDHLGRPGVGLVTIIGIIGDPPMYGGLLIGE